MERKTITVHRFQSKLHDIYREGSIDIDELLLFLSSAKKSGANRLILESDYCNVIDEVESLKLIPIEVRLETDDEFEERKRRRQLYNKNMMNNYLSLEEKLMNFFKGRINDNNEEE